MKSRYICTFKVKKANIAKLETPSGGRTLTVKKLTKDEDKKVISVVLEGAKEPILLSCETEYSQVGTTNRMPNFPLTQDVLTGFKEFGLGAVYLEKESTLQPPPPKVEPKNSGGVI